MSQPRLFALFQGLLRAAAPVALACASPQTAVAQSYPSKVVQLVVPFSAGGPADAMARALAAQHSTALKNSVIVVNQAGAAGNLDGKTVAQAQPDGHTLLLMLDTALTANALIYGSKMGYYPVAEAGFPGATLEFSMVLLAPAKTPDAIVRTLHEEACKALTGPGMSQLMANNDYMVIADTPEQAAARLAATRKRPWPT